MAVIVFATTVTFAQNPVNNIAFNKFLEKYYVEYMKHYPLVLTDRGDNRYNDKLTNTISVAFLKEIHNLNIKYQKRLLAFNRESLNSFDRISYDILSITIKNSLEEEQFHLEYIPFNQISGLPLSFPSLGSGHSYQPFKTVKDYRNWLKRIDGFTVYIDTAIANFNKGISSGIVLPKSLVIKMIPQLQAQNVTDTAKNIFYKPILNMPSTFSAKDKAKLRLAYQKAITNKVIPTYAKLTQYFQDEYLPKARLTSGYNALPNGDALYNFKVRVQTTTDKTPEEIHQIGLNQVERITQEIETLKNKIGFQGSIIDFYNYSLTSKDFFPFTTDEEILDSFRSILPRIEPNLKKIFSLRPKSSFEVRAVEKFKAASANIYYETGVPDGSRPGYLNIPILDPTQFNKLGIETIFLHEAIPGHHFQSSLKIENQSLPKIRQFGSFSVFSEGWGLYAESLGEELGLYTDPYQKLAAYKLSLFRAIRLVVDTGLHTGIMTREEAIKYMMEKNGKDEQGSISEIERYMANPGQALCYKIGELKIQELKAKCQKRLGSRFDIKKFHDAVLQEGSMPLPAFESYMSEWANEQSNPDSSDLQSVLTK
jgi:uncharacterized protein (DUF885 family)